MPTSNTFIWHKDQDASSTASELEAILAACSDAIFTKNLDNIITSWSVGATRLYGYSAEEIVGKSVSILVPPDRIDEIQEINGMLRSGLQCEMETGRITKSGKILQVALTVTPIRDVNGNVVRGVSITRDLTVALQTEREMASLRSVAAERSVIIDTAHQVAFDILSRRTGVEALTHIANAARTLAKAQFAALGVARTDGPGLQEFVTVGLTPDEEKAIGRRPVGEGILGFLLQQTEPLRIDKLSQHSNSVGFPPNHPVMESFLGVPIRRGSTVFGSLYLTEKLGGGQFTDEDEVAVQALSAHAAVAIHSLLMMSRQRALIRGLISAQDDERRAVAYDLHDGLTQFVMAAHMHLETSQIAHHSGNSDKAQRELDKGIHYLKESVLESRRLVNGLRALALDDLGLIGALEQLINEEKARTGWGDVELMHNIVDRRFSKTLESTAYRILQEALTNVRKHAETSRVRIVVLFDDDDKEHTLLVEVQDWGNGFDTREKANSYRHWGLQGMVERVQLIGGTHEIHSIPGEGTTIRCVFPVADEDDSQDTVETP